MFEDLYNIMARERALIEADMWAEMERDLTDEAVQRAYSVHPEQVKQGQDERDLDFGRIERKVA